MSATHFPLILFMAGWFAEVDVGVFDIKPGIYIAENDLVGFDNALQIYIYEEVIGVNVLFD